MKIIKILSLFDGISCGRVAFERANIRVSRYVAYEIDKYAKAISKYNYSYIDQYGDVLQADFSQYKEFDFLIGGSPCKYWSVANNNREIDKYGNGWKLFMGYKQALSEISPRFFLFENVVSMPENIKYLISEELGVEPILINSSLVCAQQRKRLYWTNIQGVTQPMEKEIYVKDILESGLSISKDKIWCLTANYGNAYFPHDFIKHQRTMVAEPVLQTSNKPIRIGTIGKGSQGSRIYSVNGKTVCLSASGGGQGATTGLYKIDLPDGEYTIRKLTPIEAEKCQTLPINYTAFGIDETGAKIEISNRQRFKSIGNGWTVDIIAHILRFTNC